MRSVNWTKYQVASFDIFDTLIERTVCKPSDVFEIVEMWGKSLGLNCDGYALARVEAEKTARTNARYEISIDDIYASFASDLTTPSDLSILKKLELDVERSVCRAKPEGRQLFNEAKDAGLKIAIVSDMYMSKRFISELIMKCGYSDWDYLLVSCEHNATKANGNLFHVLVELTTCDPCRIIHIGDNRVSDIRNASALGFGTLYISRTRHSRIYTGVADSAMTALTENHASSHFGDMYSFGHTVFGPILAGFASWLDSELDAGGFEKVFYFARDGLIVMRAMELLHPNKYESTYLYVSRRALQVPSFLFVDNFTEMIHSMFLPRVVTIEKIYAKAGINEELTCEMLWKAGIDAKRPIPLASLNDDREAIRSFGVMRTVLHDTAREELDLLAKYLRQSRFEGKVAIVDIGWYGNMQHAIERVCKGCGIDVDVSGYYVGLNPDGLHQYSHQMKGWLFDGSKGKNLYKRERNFNIILETLFSAPHGTTIGYKEYDGAVHPILGVYDGAEYLTGQHAQKAREGALRFVADWKDLFAGIGTYPLISCDAAIASISKLGEKPTLAEASFFGDWCMETDGKLLYAARPRMLPGYLRNPRAFIDELAEAPWKIGFMRRLFRASLPYGAAWNFIHDVYGLKKKLL